MVINFPLLRLSDEKITAINKVRLFEFVAKLILPLLCDPGRRYNEDPSCLSFTLQGGEKQSHLNGLAEAHVISDEPIVIARTEYPVHELYLVRQRIYIEPIQ